MLTLLMHEKQASSQGKCREQLSNLPSHPDNVKHQGIFISLAMGMNAWNGVTMQTYLSLLQNIGVLYTKTFQSVSLSRIRNESL